MMNIIRIFLILLLLVAVIGCGCQVNTMIATSIGIDDYIRKTGIIATPVTEEEYNSITHDNRYTSEVDATINNNSCGNGLGSAFIFTDNRVDEGHQGKLVFHPIYVPPGIDVGRPPYDRDIGTFYSGFKYEVFAPAVEQGKVFKMDVNNRNHLYLYYHNTWWLWDVSRLNINWDLYTTFPENNVSFGIGLEF